MAAFVIGICTALVDAVRSRQEAQSLLGDLEVANAELTRRAERIRELAIAEERARISREMHDTLGHHLTAINLQLQNAERFGDRDPERSRRKIREARESTLAALAEIRRTVRALKPAVLDARDVSAAIRALTRSFDGTGIDVTCDVQGDVRALPEGVELAIYRATQEGLTNAAKHSNADHVMVTLGLHGNEARLVVSGNGLGARAEPIERGFGLAALRERVEGLGGTLDTTGVAEGGGFVLEAVLPIDGRRGEKRD